MVEHATLKAIHVALAATAGTLFVTRGAARLLGRTMPPRLAVVPHLVDSLLLAAGLLLAWRLGAAAPIHGWLGAKLAGIAAYIVFGAFALKRAKRGGGAAVAFVFACAAFAYVVFVAITRSAAGPFALL
jgi:uncharacterized membrane protein SirB2